MSSGVSQTEERRCSVVWWYGRYHLSDGSRVNRLWVGWVLAFSILWSLCRHLNTDYIFAISMVLFLLLLFALKCYLHVC